MSSPNSSPTVGLVPELTKSELKVLNIIKEGTIDSKQIMIFYNSASTRKTGMRNIQKIIKKLKEKGTLGISSPIANQNELACEPNELNGIRLHAQQFLIEPITKSIKYNKSISKKIEIDGNTVLINNDVIQYYCNKTFFASDSYASTAKSMNYLDRIVRTLENDLGCILIKPRSQNITMVKSEYAHINNGLAVKLHREGEKFKCRASEDGHVWFIIDNSWNLKEAETTGKTATRDMQRVIEPVFNDMRDNKFYLMSDTKSMIDNLTLVAQYNTKSSENLVKSNLEYKPLFEEMNHNLNRFASAMAFYGEHFKSHAGLIKEGTDMFKKMNKKLSQKKLGEFL